MKQSAQWTLNKADLISLAKGLAITMAGAGLTYLSEYMTKQSFGAYTPMVMTMWALFVNVVRKLLAGETK